MAGVEFPTGMIPDELRRYLDLLNRLVAEKKITRRELDSRLGWKGGVAARLLRGERGDLRMSQLLGILRVLDVEPLAFFLSAHADAPASAWILAHLDTLPASPEPLFLPPVMSEEEFSRRIQEALEKALKVQSATPAAQRAG
jgi:DNA-binding Xre family transcriptional regulator